MAIVLGLFLTNLANVLQNQIGLAHETISNGLKVMILIALIPCISVYIKRLDAFLGKFLFFIALLIILQLLFFNNDFFF